MMIRTLIIANDFHLWYSEFAYLIRKYSNRHKKRTPDITSSVLFVGRNRCNGNTLLYCLKVFHTHPTITA
jgi:hypothetical protein